MRLGLREANQQFSRAIKAVRSGEPVILTERGRPIAVIAPLRAAQNGSVMLERLAQAGLIRLPQKDKRLPASRPVRARGPEASQLLAKERDER
jgi:prevent-host-death family protein